MVVYRLIHPPKGGFFNALMSYPNHAIVHALTLLELGYSYRDAGESVKKTEGKKPSLSTVHEWVKKKEKYTNEIEAHKKRLEQEIKQKPIRIADKLLDSIESRIEAMSDRDTITSYGVIMDKIIEREKMMQQQQDTGLLGDFVQVMKQQYENIRSE